MRGMTENQPDITPSGGPGDTPSGLVPTLVALVPAAGVGQRALQPGAIVPKQYREIAGVPMLRRTVLALLADPRVQQVHVIVSADDDRVAAVLAGLPRTRWYACGGAERHQTVANGLAAAGLPDACWVLVHDAARPGLPAAALAALIDACLDDPVGGLLALPVADTLKRVQGPAPAAAVARVAATVPRAGLWQAQTPQMFRAGMLRRALQAAHEAGTLPTDEASAIEALGLSPCLVPGSVANGKITWPHDFLWIEKWLA